MPVSCFLRQCFHLIFASLVLFKASCACADNKTVGVSGNEISKKASLVRNEESVKRTITLCYVVLGRSHHHRVLRAMSMWKTTVSMDSERERRCRHLVPCLILVGVILLVYTVASTIYIILQSQKLDTLERLTMSLSDRVDKMEDKLSAKTVEHSRDESKNTFEPPQIGRASCRERV